MHRDGSGVFAVLLRAVGHALVITTAIAPVCCGGDDGSDSSAAQAPAGGGTSGNQDEGWNPDIDANHDGIPDTGTSCKAVDILFVVDNSPSMKPYQEGLAAAFPGFVDAMYAKLPKGTDLHVGITTTSFWAGDCAEGHVNCQTTATPEEVKAHYLAPTEGSTKRNGEQGRLFQYDGKYFVTANTNDGGKSGLKEWFAGAAVAAGEQGCSFEMSSAGAAYAFNPVNAATNKDFLRDENTVLLLFVLSDEPDKSPEAISTYEDMVRSAKGACGGDQCIRTSGLLTPCVIAGQNQLSDFLNGFGESAVLGSIEDPAKYTDVVGQGLAKVVQEACAEIGSPK